MIVWLVDPPLVSSADRPHLTRPRDTAQLAQEQRGQHLPLLLHQHVEGAARRAELHHLEPDTTPGKLAAHLRWSEALRGTGAEQHELRDEREDRLEVSGRERIESGRRPVGDEPLGGHQAAALHALLADAQLGVGVTADQVRP